MQGGAIIWSFLLNRIHTIKNAAFTTPAFLFVIFGIVELLGFNGAIAALTFGITIGNVQSLRLSSWKRDYFTGPIGLTETEKIFFSETAFLLRTFFFVYLGISLELMDWRLALLSVAFVIIIFIARIPPVRLLISGRIPIKDASIVAVMVPKGLAAAALASVPFQQSLVGGSLIRKLTYGVILLSTVVTSLLVLFLDRTKLSNYYAWILLAHRRKV